MASRLSVIQITSGCPDAIWPLQTTLPSVFPNVEWKQCATRRKNMPPVFKRAMQIWVCGAECRICGCGGSPHRGWPIPMCGLADGGGCLCGGTNGVLQVPCMLPDNTAGGLCPVLLRVTDISSVVSLFFSHRRARKAPPSLSKFPAQCCKVPAKRLPAGGECAHTHTMRTAKTRTEQEKR